MRRMFSENQIKNMIAESPDQIVQALSNQDIKAKLVEQTPIEISFDITSPDSGLPTNCVIEDVYSKIKIYGNTMDIIFNFKIKNNGESASSASQLQYFFEIPENVAKLIYDFNGKSVNESIGSLTPITAFDYYLSTNSYPSIFGTRAIVEIVNHTAVNKMGVYIISLPSINAGVTIMASGRIELSLK